MTLTILVRMAEVVLEDNIETAVNEVSDHIDETILNTVLRQMCILLDICCHVAYTLDALKVMHLRNGSLPVIILSMLTM